MFDWGANGSSLGVATIGNREISMAQLVQQGPNPAYVQVSTSPNYARLIIRRSAPAGSLPRTVTRMNGEDVTVIPVRTRQVQQRYFKYASADST